jgi:hypothetical protein
VDDSFFFLFSPVFFCFFCFFFFWFLPFFLPLSLFFLHLFQLSLLFFFFWSTPSLVLPPFALFVSPAFIGKNRGEIYRRGDHCVAAPRLPEEARLLCFSNTWEATSQLSKWVSFIDVFLMLFRGRKVGENRRTKALFPCFLHV